MAEAGPQDGVHPTDLVFAAVFLLLVLGIFFSWVYIVNNSFAEACMLMLHNMRAQL